MLRGFKRGSISGKDLHARHVCVGERGVSALLEFRTIQTNKSSYPIELLNRSIFFSISFPTYTSSCMLDNNPITD